MGKFKGFNLLCIFFVTLLCNGVWTEDKCAVGCRSSSPAGTPSFVTGQTYTYSVEGSVSVLLSSAERQETSLKASGVFAVTALGDCAHVLRVKNLQISGPNGKKYGRPAGIEKPIRFTLQDGAVGPEICSEAGDNQRSLNFKRALVSLLQHSGKSGQEIDVFGVCPTEVATAGGGVYLRSRDLNRCAHRECGKHDLITAIYNPHSEIKASQLLQSSYNAETKLKGSAVEKVAATEEYLYRPFSVGQNGARARVVTKLTLTGQAAGADTGKFINSKPIMFENPHPTVVEHSNVPNVLLALKSAAQSLEANTGSKSAGIFANLVRVLRVTSKADLLNVYGQIKAGGAVKNNDLAKKVFLDGLLRSGTGESISAALQLIQSKELSTLEQRLIFISLSNARHATEESLLAAAKILDSPDVPREVYLGVGALAGAYCREHPCHGETSQSAGINALSKKLAAKLNGCKPANRKDEDTVVAVLKGIRSIRHIENELVDKLAHCVTDLHVKNRVKVAALEAFSADPCTPKLKKVAIDTLKNRQLDSEVRIKAYLALVECPCGKVANELKTLLDTEPVYQVGRFIVSSLRNIRASANPARESARQHFGLIRTPNKFPIDDRKFSHNQEFSYNVDALGLGATVEKNVIFSQDSFLPRSVNLNLTTEVFGHDVNILEVGVRQGNLDRVVEHFFGPKGLLKTTKPQEIYDRFLNEYRKLKDVTTGHFGTRNKRAVQQEIAAFSKHVKQELSGFDGDLDLDVFVKLFGTDAIFLSFGDEKSLTFSGIVDKLFEQLENGMDKAKQFNHELRSHLLFLDTELAYPTSIGIPLKLNLVGSSTTKLDLGGSIDFKQIIRDPRNAKVDIKFIPSANIEISGSLIADADLVSTGLKVVSNLHTSTGGHLVAKILENGRGFDVQLALPVDKQEIISVTNDIVFATQEKGQQESEVALRFDVDRKDYSGCFDQLSSALGLVLCAEFNVPWAKSGPNAGASLQRLATKYPLTGPSTISIRLDKADLKGYHIKALFNDKDPSRQFFEFVIDAEGTKSNRKTALKGELINRQDEMSVSVSLESPYKHAEAKVALTNSAKEKSISLRIRDGDVEYSGRLGFSVSGDQSRSVFTPFLGISAPNYDPKSFNIEGTINSEASSGGRKFTLNGISLILPKSEKVRVDGYVAQEAQGLSTDLKLSRADQKGTLKAKLVSIPNGAKIDAEFHNTLNPAIDFLVKYEGISQEGHIQNDLVLVHGPDSRSPTNKLTVKQNLKYVTKSLKEFDIMSKNKVSYPGLQLDFEANGEFDPKKVNMEVAAKYANGQAEFSIEGRGSTKAPGDYQVKAKGEVNGKGFEFFSKRDLDGEDRSNIQNILTVKPGGKYELSGVVNHRVKDKDINVGVVGHLKVAGKTDDYSVDVGIVANHGLYSSHVKVAVGPTEYVDYVCKINRGANPNGSLKLLIKEYINANGQFKLNGSDGKGNALLLVEFIRLKRKIKADSTIVVHEPQYDANVDLYLDFERDNNNKISLTTANKLAGENFESKNSFLVAGKKTELNLKKDSTGSWSVGKCHGLVELVLPTQRVLTLKYDRDITKKDEVYNGKANLLVSDAPRRGAQASKIEYKGQLSNSQPRKFNINYAGTFEVVLSDGKNLNTAFVFKNLPSGERFNFETKVDVTGNILTKPASFLATNDYKKTDGFYDSKYRVKSNIGSEISFEATGNTKYDIAEDSDKEFKNQMQIQVSLPLDKAHDIKITLTDDFVIPKDVTKQYEFATSKSIQVNAETYKFEASAKAGHGSGNSKVKVIVPHQDPLAFEGNYKYAKTGETGSTSSEVKVTYGKGKSVGLSFEGQKKGAGEVTGHIKATLPENENLKVLDVKINYKTNDGRSHNTQIVADADGKAYKIESQVDVSRNTPSVDIKFHCPENKNSRFFARANFISEHKVKAEVKIENLKDFNLVANVEGVTESADNFNIKVDIDSAKLKLNKVHMDISSKLAKNGRRIQFNAKSGEQNLLSGSTSYLSKQEGSKSIIEGSGMVKLRDEQKSANFKYIRDILSEGPEHGIQIFLNVALGDKSFVVEHRATNVELKLSSVYCEEKKQCAHADFSSKLTTSASLIQHRLTIGLDLRKLGLSPEFGLQASTEAGEGKLPQFLIDVHLNQDQSKYNLHAYSQPKKGAFPAGITLTLPQRVISLESSLNYPEGKLIPFPLNGEIAFYLNKNAQPNQKAAIRLHADSKYESGKSYSYVAELGFSHPSIAREALFKWKNEIQRIQDTSLTAFSTLTFSHPSFGRDKEVVARVDASQQRIKIEFRTPNVEVLSIEGHFKFENEVQSTDFVLVLLQGKPVLIHAQATAYKNFEFTTGYKDQPSNKLSVTAQLEPEKKVGLSVDIILPSEKKNIFHTALVFEGDQLKPEYGASTDNLKYFAKAVKNDFNNLAERLKQLSAQTNAAQQKDIDKATEGLKKVSDYYKAEATKIRDELINDKTLQELNQLIKNVVQSVAKVVSEIIEHATAIIDKTASFLKENYAKIAKVYQEKLLPELTQLYKTYLNIAAEIFDTILTYIGHYLALVNDFVEKHRSEIKELTTAFTEIFRDLTKIFVSRLRELRAGLTEVYQSMSQQIQEIPIITEIKNKLAEFKIPDGAFGFINELNNAIKSVLPTQETKDLVDAFYNYVVKKLKHEQVDDVRELTALLEKVPTAITSVVSFLRAQIQEYGLQGLLTFNIIPMQPGQIQSIPFFGGVSFSPLNYLLNREFPSIRDFYRAYRPRYINPLNELPPTPLRGTIVNGQHIFTLDGRHLTFPGNCRYVVAHDSLDGNFTIALTLQAGLAKAISLLDKSGSVVEYKENGQLLVNGANHGFPLINEDTQAWREPSGFIGIHTNYGALLRCSADLKICRFEISGFYLGRLRGLLGDGNNEPFDDFRLPAGKISANEGDFGNAYRLQTSCAQIKTVDHKHQHGHAAKVPQCDAYFASSSSLRMCFETIDNTPYRQACEHAVSSNAANADAEACSIAYAYVVECRSNLIPVRAPDACGKCGDKKVGDVFTATAPTKQADIIVFVETTKNTETVYRELVVPVISHVTDELKTKKIDDVKIYLVGASPKLPYPILYDNEGSKLKGKITFTDESRYATPSFPVKTGDEKLDEYLQKLAVLQQKAELETGLTNLVFAYQSLIELPLRPNAAITIVSVLGDDCKQTILPIQNLGSLFTWNFLRTVGIVNHIITPTPNLNFGTQSAQVIGFNSDTVYVLGDKKRAGGGQELRRTLDYGNDVCSEFSQKTFGNVYSSSNFLSTDAGRRKQFVQQTARSIVDSIAGFRTVRSCECEFTTGLFPQTTCSVDSRKHVATRRK